MMPSHSRSATLLAASAAALMLMACDQPKPETATIDQKIDAKIQKAGTATQTTAEQAAQKLEDAKITAGIKAELAKDPSLSALAIKVETQDGLVALNGQAPDPATRDHATRVAATVKGVLSVDNHMVLNS
jgi:hyperosmotically inducible protein